MVSNGRGESKTLKDILQELTSFRTYQHRTYTRKSDRDQYVVLMFAHDQNGGLNAVVQLAAMPQVKEIIPVNLFLADFEKVESYDPPPKVDRKRVHGSISAD